MGLDSREGEGVVARTDSIMVIGVDPGHLRVNLLSIPRDLFLDVPEYGLQRVNTINVLGEMEEAGNGPELLSTSITNNFQVIVNHYIRLDFAGFIDLVDTVGGLDIFVERVIEDHNYPAGDGTVKTVRFNSGMQHMDGEQALIYARTRQADDDYHRARRQQQVVSALASKLAHPANWLPAVGVLSQNIETDLSFIDIISLAPSVVVSSGRFEQLVIDREYITGTAGGNAVPDYVKLDSWLDEHLR